MPLYKDKTWSSDLIEKFSLSKYNNNYKIISVTDVFNKYACAILLMNKTGLTIFKSFKKILSEIRK